MITGEGTNFISYRGEVIIELQPGIKGNRIYKYKNRGTKVFFDLLSQCICGYNVISSMPKFIQFKDASNKSCLIRNIPLTGAVWGAPAMNEGDDSSLAYVLFNATVTVDDKIDGAIPSRVVIVNNNEEELASIDIDGDVYGSITETSDALITWRMIIGQSSSEGGVN